MRFSPWGTLAGLPEIEVVFADLPDALGWYDPDEHRITLDRGQSRAQMRCTLAHELEHAMWRDEDISHVSPVLAARQEIAASTRAARKLIELDDLIEALLLSQDEYELAEELNVDEDTVKLRLLTLSPEEHAVIDARIRMAERGIA